MEPVANDFHAIAKALESLRADQGAAPVNDCFACDGLGWTFFWGHSPLGKLEKKWGACGWCHNYEALSKPQE